MWTAKTTEMLRRALWSKFGARMPAARGSIYGFWWVSIASGSAVEISSQIGVMVFTVFSVQALYSGCSWTSRTRYPENVRGILISSFSWRFSISGLALGIGDSGERLKNT